MFAAVDCMGTEEAEPESEAGEVNKTRAGSSVDLEPRPAPESDVAEGDTSEPDGAELVVLSAEAGIPLGADGMEFDEEAVTTTVYAVSVIVCTTVCTTVCVMMACSAIGSNCRGCIGLWSPS